MTRPTRTMVALSLGPRGESLLRLRYGQGSLTTDVTDGDRKGWPPDWTRGQVVRVKRGAKGLI